MRNNFALKIITGCGLASLTATLALAAQSGYPFSDYETSAVEYRRTPYKAALDCKAMLASLDVHTVIRSAALIPASDKAPAHCRIDGVIQPEVGFQLNLPLAWNGRLYMYGNGGFAGEDAEAPREQASRESGLSNGFATVRTDTGHLASKEPMASFAKNPGKLVDHAYLAVHQTVAYAKRVMAAFYDRPVEYSYWQGCSTGGREGVMAAQRYPEDFDGIAAAAPTLDWNSIMIKGLWQQRALAGSGLTAAKMKTVFDTVMRQCDAKDGLKDGLIDDPNACSFQAATVLPRCAAGKDDAACLTDRQLDALGRIYSGPRISGRPASFGQLVGAEHISTMAPFLMQPDGAGALLPLMAESWMKHIVVGDSGYEVATYDFAADTGRGLAVDEIMNPKPALDAFQARGGKMITYWGWSDVALNPQMGIHFYEQLMAQHGAAKLQDYYRLFLVPGVAHCAGGYGPEVIDALTPVINWVEKGIVPDRLKARSAPEAAVQYKRAYCPYPAQTRYRGQGSSEDPSNFECVAASGSAASNGLSPR